jgi:hypothetical protein
MLLLVLAGENLADFRPFSGAVSARVDTETLPAAAQA